MPPPYLLENPYKVVIEFRKDNAGLQRTISLAHNSLEVPLQLQGSIPLEVWDPFMDEVEQLAKEHPYTTSQSTEQCCFNLGGLSCFFCIGIRFTNPDGGDYRVWERKVEACVRHHCQAFGSRGCFLSMHKLGGSYWLQIDVSPAVGTGSSELDSKPHMVPGNAFSQPHPPYLYGSLPPPSGFYPPPVSTYPHAAPPPLNQPSAYVVPAYYPAAPPMPGAGSKF